VRAPLAAFGQAAPPAADTFSLTSQPAANFGAYQSLLAGTGATTYINFDLSGFPANASVSKAVLRLYVDTAKGMGSVDAYRDRV
jgi:hypothetical protein